MKDQEIENKIKEQEEEIKRLKKNSRFQKLINLFLIWSK